MGLDFIRDQKEKYEQKRDASLLSIDLHDLFEFANPDQVTERFSVKLRAPDIPVVRGLRYLLRFNSDNSANLVGGATVIGKLLPDDAADLAARIQASGKASGMITVLADSEPDFAGFFHVKLLKRTNRRQK